jgi:hypothetical protein
MDAVLNSAALLFLILMADFAFTLLHSYQEWKDAGAPLWRNFGAIVGLDIPDKVGFLVFTVSLTLTLLAIAFVGVIGPIGPRSTALALGALIGARLSDTLVSHVLVYGVGYRPNPGLSSTPLYVLEALFIFMAFGARLEAAPGLCEIGTGLGSCYVLVGMATSIVWAMGIAILETPTLAALATDAVVGINKC